MVVHRRLDEDRQGVKQEQNTVVGKHIRAAYIIFSRRIGPTVFFLTEARFDRIFDPRQRK
jgi:hypothetical protein